MQSNIYNSSYTHMLWGGVSLHNFHSVSIYGGSLPSQLFSIYNTHINRHIHIKARQIRYPDTHDLWSAFQYSVHSARIGTITKYLLVVCVQSCIWNFSQAITSRFGKNLGAQLRGQTSPIPSDLKKEEFFIGPLLENLADWDRLSDPHWSIYSYVSRTVVYYFFKMIQIYCRFHWSRDRKKEP